MTPLQVKIVHSTLLTFPSRVGRDQKQSEERANIGLTFAKWRQDECSVAPLLANKFTV